MSYQKDNFLQISYQYKKGLLLNWNFTDLHQTPNYYHHLLILFNQKDKTNLHFIEQYYKRMKFGDLIAIIYFSHNGPRRMNWVEKTQLTTVQFPKIIDKIIKDPLSKQQAYQLIKYAADFTVENNSSNVISNFILGRDFRNQGDLIIQQISNLRQEGAFTYHCTFFNLYAYNKISFSNGFHFLNSETKELFQLLSLHHLIVNNAAIRSAHITINCHNGQMMSYNAQTWKNTQFNRIERTFYGPSINYMEDLIQFHVLDAFDDTEFEMDVSLELLLFSGQMISANKKLKLSFIDERHYDKSLNLTLPQPLMTYQGVELKNNPFATNTFVRLMKSTFKEYIAIKDSQQISYMVRRTRQRKVVKLTQKQDKQLTKKRPMEYFVVNKDSEEEKAKQLLQS